MPVHLLSDVDIEAISLVRKGDNRKRIFLMKAADNPGDELVAGQKLLKSEDWSAFYVVVAEPGHAEGPGVADGAGSGIDDVWASEDEIRRAAHKFMKNGALVNRMHEDLTPYGTVVENAIALSDFEVNGETIKKGSWYIAIAPTEEGKQAVDAGEFGGVSIQGTGVRTLAKGQGRNAPVPRKCKSCGATLAKDAGKCQSCGKAYVKKEEEARSMWSKLGELLGLSEPGDEVVGEQTYTAKSPASGTPSSVTVRFHKDGVAEVATSQAATQEEQEEMETNQQIKELESKLEKQSEDIGKLVSAVETLAKREEEQKPPTVEDLHKQLGELSNGLQKIEKSVELLGEGETAQSGGDKIKKSDSNPLAGILFD